MVESILYDVVRSNEDLNQILHLQSLNLPKHISRKEKIKEGFVTVQHTFDQLSLLNTPYPHIIAKHNNSLVGYALVMLSENRSKIPVLVPFFDRLDAIDYHGKPLSELNYFVMGQVCIAKPFRGLGVFQGLYLKMKREMKDAYSIVVTSVSTSNPRSIKAHEKVGFIQLDHFRDITDDWVIVGWDIGMGD